MNITKPIAPDTLKRMLERWEYIQSVERNVLAYSGNEKAGYAEIARLKSKFADEAAATLEANNRQLQLLVEELKLWRILVNEGGVPRYTITPGAALNTVVTSTDRLIARHSRAYIEGVGE